MFSGSSVSSTYLPIPKSSRFSMLKTFKFSSKGKDTKPPPPPPKDPYYLKNMSHVSLALPSPSPLTQPSQYTQGSSSDATQSTLTLVSSAASAISSRSKDNQQKKDKGLSFFKRKRGARSMRSRKSSEGDDPPPPDDDENISMPWNFQHHIHVDEAYTGLPPSWTVSLLESGLTEEEIAQINSRRAAGSRSPGSQFQYLYTDRPSSPLSSSNSHAYPAGVPPPPTTILTNPTPRTTSLPRQYSDASLRAGSLQGRPRSPPLPAVPLVTTTHATPSSHSTRSDLRMNSLPQETYMNHNPSFSVSSSFESHHSANVATSNGQDNVASPIQENAEQPSNGTTTPPRRTYHVTNASPAALRSPPPAYGNPTSYPDEKKKSPVQDNSPYPSDNSTPGVQHTESFTSTSSAVLPNTQPELVRSNSTESMKTSTSESSPSSPNVSVKTSPSRSKRTTALPPRLSLHKASESTDLSLWTQALLSGISSGGLDDTFTLTTPDITKSSASFDSPSNQSQFATRLPGNSLELSNAQSGIRIESSRTSQYSEAGQVLFLNEPKSPQDVQYMHASPSSRNGESPMGTSPLWNEIEGMLRDDNLGGNRVYSATLTDSSSPLAPSSPSPKGPRQRTGSRNFDDGNDNNGSYLDMLNDQEDDNFLGVSGLESRTSNRDSSRSSSSTLSTSTVTGIQPTIVRNVSIARRTGAYVIDKTKAGSERDERDQLRERMAKNSIADEETSLESPVAENFSLLRPSSAILSDSKHPPSPLSSHFESEEGSSSGSGSSSSQSQDHPTPITEVDPDSPVTYQHNNPQVGPRKSKFILNPQTMLSMTDTFGGFEEVENDRHSTRGTDTEDEGEVAEVVKLPSSSPVSRSVSISTNHSLPTLRKPSNGGTVAPSTPKPTFQQYRGWLSEVVAPLEDFIDEAVDPREHYLNLQEIAEGESGFIYAASLSNKNAHKLKLPPLVKAKDRDDLASDRGVLVAIKSVAIVPSGSAKLVDLERELKLMKGLWQENILGMDALYVDLAEDSLWIRMELMERSLADLVGLVSEGLMLQDRMIARFASDMLNALEYLQRHQIAHRDVRSDNMLLNSRGVLKLADFSNAVQVTKENPMCSNPAGVVYWQAPEMRSPPYNALQVDVWSLGATVWEMAQTEPPFSDTNELSDRWPPLSHPELYSPSFHNFLQRCSEPASSRPKPSDLTKLPFINNACGRPVIIQLLAQSMAIETILQEREEQGPTSE